MLSPIHWNAACLCVNSGNINDDVNKASDYGAMAKAIAQMPKGFVTPPRINESELGFKVNMKEGKVVYGIGAIAGINYDVANLIISGRPYKSFNDFIDKCVKTKHVQPSKVYNLIKGGCFDEFGDRLEIMREFINYLVPDKNKLTTANIPKLAEFGAIPQRYANQTQLYFFRKNVFNKKNCIQTISSTIGIYRVPNEYMYLVNENFLCEFIDAVEYDAQGNVCLRNKEFDSIYKSKIKELDDWLRGKEALNMFNMCNKGEVWNKYCSGTVSKWEMDSIGYYTKIHELTEINVRGYYNLSDFSKLSTEPNKVKKINLRTGREYYQMELSTIAGVVVDKNKTKKMVTVSTEFGVVEVKMYQEEFAFYDKKTTEDSWFKRGERLLIVGYRRGEVFVPRTYYDSTFSSSIMKIDTLNGKVVLRERI